MKKLGKFFFSDKSLKQYKHQNGKKTKDIIEEKISAHVNKRVEQISNLIKKNCLNKNLNNIIDIGCGLSLVNTILSKYFNNSMFYNLDKYDSQSIDYHGGFHSDAKNFKTRCDVKITKQFHIDNKVDISRQAYIDAHNLEEIKDVKFDLIISIASWCYHYSFETYENIVKNNTNDNTIFIIRIRPNKRKEIINKFKKYNFDSSLDEESGLVILKKNYSLPLISTTPI